MAEILPPEQISAHADCFVRIGTYLDGLPLVLSLKRSVDLRRAVARELGADVRTLPPAFAAPLAALEEAASAEQRMVGVLDITSSGRYGDAATPPAFRAYVSHQNIDRVLGDSLLVRVLGEYSPMSLEDEARGRAYTGGGGGRCASGEVEHTGVDVSKYENGLSSIVGGTTHLCVPLDSKLPLAVARMSGDQVQPVRTFIEESVHGIAGVAVSARVYSNGHTRIDALEPARAHDYAASLLALLREAGEVDARFTIDRKEVVALLVAVARRVHADYHARALVHADIKPSNVLIRTDGGVALIDAVGVPAGGVSVVASAGWAAPEQIRLLPVTAAADVYPLAQMVVAALGAQIYGEEKTFVVPFKGGRKRVVLLDRCGVAVRASATAPASADGVADGSVAGRVAWQAFLARCLALEPEVRPASAAVFADELESLLARHPPDGTLPVAPAQYGAHLRACVVDGAPAACWVLTDSTPATKRACC